MKQTITYFILFNLLGHLLIAMEQASPLQPGDIAPSFSFVDSEGKEHDSSSLAGKPYIVYFYPKDDTPGCTKQACGFRDLFSEFTNLGVTVIGASADSDQSHDKFREKYSLPFPLISDPDKDVIKAFGVWGEKKFMGKTYEGIHRISFLIGKDGKIIKTYEKVKAEENPQEMLADAKALL